MAVKILNSSPVVVSVGEPAPLDHPGPKYPEVSVREDILLFIEHHFLGRLANDETFTKASAFATAYARENGIARKVTMMPTHHGEVVEEWTRWHDDWNRETRYASRKVLRDYYVDYQNPVIEIETLG